MLYAAILETKGYVVGAANAPSGLHRHQGGQTWQHLGWTNVRAFGMAVDPTDPNLIYLAAGNGVLRSTDAGATWRVTTNWQLTEVLDVILDPFNPAQVYIATAYGVWTSPDRGHTWQVRNRGLRAPNTTFTQTIAADHTRPGRLLIGTEDGLFESADHANSWRPIGPRQVPVRTLQQSRADPACWLASTEDHGLLHTRNGGHTWHHSPDPLHTRTLYAVALHPRHPGRWAVAGYETGVWFSADGGGTWQQRHTGISDRTIKALAWDAERLDRLWVGMVEAGVYWTEDEGVTWQDAGLPEAFVSTLLTPPASTA